MQCGAKCLNVITLFTLKVDHTAGCARCIVTGLTALDGKPRSCQCLTVLSARLTDVSDIHSAALRAAVWSVVGARAKQLENEAKEELAALPPGDTVAGRWNGEIIAKATMTMGGTKVVVTDERALLEWVQENHPTEVVMSVNPAFLEVLKKRAKVDTDLPERFM